MDDNRPRLQTTAPSCFTLADVHNSAGANKEANKEAPNASTSSSVNTKQKQPKNEKKTKDNKGARPKEFAHPGPQSPMQPVNTRSKTRGNSRYVTSQSNRGKGLGGSRQPIGRNNYQYSSGSGSSDEGEYSFHDAPSPGTVAEEEDAEASKKVKTKPKKKSKADRDEIDEKMRQDRVEQDMHDIREHTTRLLAQGNDDFMKRVAEWVKPQLIMDSPRLEADGHTKISDMKDLNVFGVQALVKSSTQTIMHDSAYAIATSTKGLKHAQDNTQDLVKLKRENQKLNNKIANLERTCFEANMRIKDVEEESKNLVLKMKMAQAEEQQLKDAKFVRGKALKFLQETPAIKAKMAADAGFFNEKTHLINAFVLFPKTKKFKYDDEAMANLQLGIQLNSPHKKEQIMDLWALMNKEDKEQFKIENFKSKFKHEDDKKFSKHQRMAAEKNCYNKKPDGKHEAPFYAHPCPPGFYEVQETGIRHVNRTCKHYFRQRPLDDASPKEKNFYIERMIKAKEVILKKYNEQIMEDAKKAKDGDYTKKLLKNLKLPCTWDQVPPRAKEKQ